MFKKIAIIGVGLIGGSIGIAARKRMLAQEIVGIGRRLSSINKAIQKGAIDKGTLDLKAGVEGADLIIVATPVDIVAEKIKETAKYLKKGAIIIDVNSTKHWVVGYADKIMPKGVYFVGTHPIAGSENRGILNASCNIFKNTMCVITPTKKTDINALKKITRFWQKLGARTEFLSPHRHDKIFANISHLPHLISYNLCYAVPKDNLKLTGSGFKDTTRIAKSNPKMWAGIFFQNRRNLLRSIEIFERGLKLFKSDIKKNGQRSLLNRLYLAKRKRDSIG